ncbi:MAG: hypothetical protein FWE35_13395 [Streptosporangiales bacterium]|nr:hypothetical protein [Streptosporangiales bacterium]
MSVTMQPRNFPEPTDPLPALPPALAPEEADADLPADGAPAVLFPQAASRMLAVAAAAAVNNAVCFITEA